MSDRDADEPTTPVEGEPMLRRWSRLKAQARVAERTPAPVASGPAREAPPTATVPVGEPPRVELPDLASLGQDSDYSAFLAPGVDLSLRQLALRKLFASPKFNVFDGLDTYRDDFTSFPALGNIVTADMRHQVERLARQALAKLESGTEGEPAPAITAPVQSVEARDDAAAPTVALDDLPTPALPAPTSVDLPDTGGIQAVAPSEKE